MFLRIKRRTLASRGKPRYSIRLMLVKSVRVEGKPRQKIVLYLGSIRDNQLKDLGLRRGFLIEVFDRLERSGLSATDSARLKVLVVQMLSQASRKP